MNQTLEWNGMDIEVSHHFFVANYFRFWKHLKKTGIVKLLQEQSIILPTKSSIPLS